MGDGRVSCHDEGRAGLIPMEHIEVSMEAATDGLLLHERRPQTERVHAKQRRPLAPLAGQPAVNSPAAAQQPSIRPPASRRAPPLAAAHRPFLAHANGLHWQLDVLLRKWTTAHAEQAAGHAGGGRHPAASLPPPLGARVWPPPPALLAHKVLLLGPVAGGCHVSTLGEVLPSAATRMSLLWVKNQKRLGRARGRTSRGSGDVNRTPTG